MTERDIMNKMKKGARVDTTYGKKGTIDIYDAFCAAFCKRAYGTNSALKRELNKILVVKEKKEKK